MRSRLALRHALASVAALAACALFAAPAWGGGFFVGFAEDAPKDEWGGLPFVYAQDLGASAFRITLMWSPGQTTVSDADAVRLDRAVGGAGGVGMGIVLAVYADAALKAPRDDLAREQYCSYVRDALVREPAINDVVLWNEPNSPRFWRPQFNADGTSAAPSDYEALAARCWDVLHALRPSVNVIAPATAPRGNDTGSHSPGNFIRKLGEAYRASGRTLPILDTVGHHIYGDTSSERPWFQHIGSKTIAEGDWNKLMSNLASAFDGTAQPLPGQCRDGRCVSIYYLESGFQTQPDAAKASLYTGTETEQKPVVDYAGGEPESPPPSATSLAPDQATQITDAVRLAACQPYVGAYFNFLLWDEVNLFGWQSAPYWSDRTPKESLPMFRQVFAEATSGTVNCAALKGGRPSADYAPPPAIVDLGGQGFVNPLRIALGWSAVADESGPPAGYRVYRDGSYYAWSDTTAFTDANVSGGTTYTYTVYAQDRAGNLGVVSNKISLSIDTQAPTAPSNLTAQPLTGPGRVVLSWMASGDNVAVAAYQVYRDGIMLGEIAGETFTDTTVTGPATYSYAVVARDAAGNLGAPATVSVTTPDLAAPTAPTGLRAVPYSKPVRVVLLWSPASDNVGVAGYRVYRNGAVVATVTSTTYTDMAVARSTTYTYSVAAYDAAGNAGPRSASASAKTPKN